MAKSRGMKNKYKKLQKEDFFSSNARIILAAIILLGITYRIIFFHGVGASDDLAYAEYATHINQGIPADSTLTLSTRLGVIYPTAVSYKIFGINDFSSVLFILITSIGNIILAYFFGKFFAGNKVGLMSSFLMAIFPLEVINGTGLLADIPSSFFMALGVYLFLKAEKYNCSSVHYFLSGIFIGIGYFIRESAILILLFFAIYVVINRKIKKQYFLVALGFLVIFCLELLAFYKLTGDPFFKYSTVQKFLYEATKEHDFFGRLDFPKGTFHFPYIIIMESSLA